MQQMGIRPTCLSALQSCAPGVSQTFILHAVPGSNTAGAVTDQKVRATDLFWRAQSSSLGN